MSQLTVLPRGHPSLLIRLVNAFISTSAHAVSPRHHFHAVNETHYCVQGWMTGDMSQTGNHTVTMCHRKQSGRWSTSLQCSKRSISRHLSSGEPLQYYSVGSPFPTLLCHC
ncbi:hypothetical protein J3F84DRAFT_208484 [Trichoderma pleuroticola]